MQFGLKRPTGKTSERANGAQLQLNARVERRESGDNADVDNSGATVNLTNQFKLYGFFRVPVYQRVNGLQIEPRSSFSLGVHHSY